MHNSLEDELAQHIFDDSIGSSQRNLGKSNANSELETLRKELELSKAKNVALEQELSSQKQLCKLLACYFHTPV